MEDETMADLSNSSERIPTGTLDPALQKKHQSMLERLSERHQTRLARKSDSPDSSLESTSSFLSRFNDCKRSIDTQLAESSELIADPSRLKSHLVDISSSISNLEKLVAENSYFLPSYEVRSSLKTISDLKQALENLNSELIPRKKFAFRNKATKKDNPIVTEPSGTPSEKSSSGLPEKSSFLIPESPGFRNKENELLVKNFKGFEMGEFTLSDLDSCEVRLIGSARAIFAHRLRNCRVYAGPVTGSILIDNVEGCVFVLASHQIRIHEAKACDFYLRVRSRPIIEDSNGVRFAPYCLRYQGIEEDLEEAGLHEETANWANVDDFRWLRAVQSPNWTVLEEGQRIESVDISYTDSGNVA
ncbi:tubulin-folding cofactor C-like [Tripterygium wilfordii]|uniref:Tubulin-folding cofactor C-like n=1 Tax=Tripterygium wilfordii TaxID=458696 RepID=A0A7J7DLV6_TRIWF|nr:tubulin-folding cofactor C [Tripterygium wilfordii]KAF5747352.1 tubulin-folding cofactor C-like [Tripterygium wilfordii]